MSRASRGGQKSAPTRTGGRDPCPAREIPRSQSGYDTLTCRRNGAETVRVGAQEAEERFPSARTATTKVTSLTAAVAMGGNRPTLQPYWSLTWALAELSCSPANAVASS